MHVYHNEYKVGDRVVEKRSTNLRNRVGEIVFIPETENPRFRLMELVPHTLMPKYSENCEKLRFFSAQKSNCRKLRDKRSITSEGFSLGAVVRHRKGGKIQFGIIVGFHHPDGLYCESYEKGYNGKDIIECVEISGRAGLPTMYDQRGRVKRFRTGPEKLKICKVLPMDSSGGVRIENYWEIKKRTSMDNH